MSTATTTLLSPADPGRRMTLQQFLEAKEVASFRYVLARGVLEVTHVPKNPHGMIVFELYVMLGADHREHPGIIRRFGGGNEIRLYLPGMDSGRNPDVGVILRNAPRNPRGLR